MSLRGFFFGRSELRAGWRFLIFLSMVLALFYARNLFVRTALRGVDHDLLHLFSQFSRFLIVLLASWLMAIFEKRTIAEYGLPWRRMFRSQFWLGVAFGFASLTLLLLVMRMAGVFHIQSIALHGAAIWKWASIWGVVFLIVAFSEEFTYRGYSLFTLTSGIRFWPAAILCSAYFGYSHSGNPGENPAGLVNAGAFGLLLCLLLRRTGNLWMPIGMHLGWDWGETFFYGVADSGAVTPGHFLNSIPTGPTWLSGGTTGPEGSWLCVLLLAVMWVAFAVWFREVKYPRPLSAPARQTLVEAAGIEPGK